MSQTVKRTTKKIVWNVLLKKNVKKPDGEMDGYEETIWKYPVGKNTSYQNILNFHLNIIFPNIHYILMRVAIK